MVTVPCGISSAVLPWLAWLVVITSAVTMGIVPCGIPSVVPMVTLPCGILSVVTMVTVPCGIPSAVGSNLQVYQLTLHHLRETEA